MDSHDDFKKVNASGGKTRFSSDTQLPGAILQSRGLAGQADDAGGTTFRSRIAKEEMKRMFKNYMGPLGTSDENIRQEMGRYFFRHFGNDADRPREDYADKDRRLKEKITALQKRTTETLQALTQCKESVESVDIIDSRPEVSDDADSADQPSLDELTEKLSNMQTSTSSESKKMDVPLDRPDIDDITKATSKLLDDLQRISNTYGSPK